MEKAYFIKFVSIMTTLLVVIVGSFLVGAWFSVSKVKRIRELPEGMKVGPMIGGGLFLSSIIFFPIAVIFFFRGGLILAASALVIGTVGLVLMYPQRKRSSTFFALLGAESIAIFIMLISCSSCSFEAIYYFFFLLILGPLVLFASNIIIAILQFIQRVSGSKINKSAVEK